MGISSVLLLVPVLAIVLAAVLRPRSIWVPLMLFTPLVFGEHLLEEAFGVEQGTTLQKAWFLAAIVIVMFLLGIRRAPRPIIVLYALLSLGLIVGLLTLNEAATLGPGILDARIMVMATLGYGVAWLLFFVNWDKISPLTLAASLSWLPLLALGLSVYSMLFGLGELSRYEWTGQFRLTGNLSAAHLGAIGVMGAVGAIWWWLQGRPWAILLVMVNLAITGATNTRIPMVVAAIVLLFVAVHVLFVKIPGRMFFLVSIVTGGLLAAVLVVPSVLERTFTQWEEGASINTSGRSEAWPYFFSYFEERPFTGWGPGASSTLSQLTDNWVIQENFRAPHNTYLQLLVDFGWIIALGITLAMFSVFLRVVSRNVAMHRTLLLGLMVGWAIYTFTDNTLTVVAITVPLAALLAFMYQHGNRAGTDSTEDSFERWPLLRQLMQKFEKGRV